MRYECYTNDASATRGLHKRHESDTSDKTLNLITTHFHNPIITIWQVKDYKERKKFILSKIHSNSLPCHNVFENFTTKTEL